MEKKAPKTQAPKKTVPMELYNEYTQLKTVEVSGAKLTEGANNKLNELEKQIKSYSGKVANKTVTRAVKAEIVKLYEGVPVPKEIEEILGKDSKDIK